VFFIETPFEFSMLGVIIGFYKIFCWLFHLEWLFARMTYVLSGEWWMFYRVVLKLLV